MKSDGAKVIQIVDGPLPTSPQGHVVFNWSDIDGHSEGVSLSQEIDRNCERLKKRYLEWMSQLADIEYKGQSLIDHFEFEKSLSFWWLTSISEKSPHKCPQIFEVLKLIVLEEQLEKHNVSKVHLHSSNKNLAEVIKTWADVKGWKFELTAAGQGQSPWGVKRLLKALPHPVQALLCFARKFYYKSLAGSLPKGASFQSDELSVVCYFPNFDSRAFSNGDFRSKYWGKIHDVFDEEGLKINWHLYFSFNDKMNYKESVGAKSLFNQTYRSKAKEKFFMLESFLSWRKLYEAVLIYFRFLRVGFAVKDIRKDFVFEGSKINFWPLLRNEWRSSSYGFAAMESALMFKTFDGLIEKIRLNKYTLFSWENQFWEKALMLAARKHNYRGILGYQHTWPRYWDLRMFEEAKDYHREKFPAPTADILAVGGETPAKLMSDFGYPDSRLKVVDMIRYDALRSSYNTLKSEKSEPIKGRTLLVATGVIYNESFHQLKTLVEASQKGGLESYSKVLIKPHPDTPVDGMLSFLKPDFPWEIISGALIDAFQGVDAVFTSNSTFVSVEASWMGIPAVAMAGVDSLNLCPMFGSVKDADFIANSDDLARFLREPRVISVPENLLCFSPNYSKWRGLLNHS